MHLRSSTLALGLLSIGFSFGVSTSLAGTILNVNSDAKGGVGQLETLTWTFNGTSMTGLAGTISSTPLPGKTSYDTYCIDMYHDFTVGNGGTTWQAEVLPISSFAGDVGVSSPDNAGGHAGAIGYLYDKYASSVTTAIQGAALQVAIWKVDYDDSNSFSTGSFRFAATPNDPNSIQSLVFAQATAYLAGFNGTQTNYDASYVRATSHPNGLYQDLVGPGTGATPNAATAVPEPSSMLMCGMAGVVGLVTHRVRRKRTA